MEIYRVWTESNHNVTYYLRHFSNKDAAEYWYKCLLEREILSSSSAGPDNGIDEIDVDDRTVFDLIKDKDENEKK